MIIPTVGRVVWFFNYSSTPLSASVAHVNWDGTINIGYLTTGGEHYGAIGIPLWQGEGVKPDRRCEWMPYQKGQAAKYEALVEGTK